MSKYQTFIFKNFTYFINFKFKWIKLSYHKDKMVKDYAKVQNPSNIVSDWQYPVQNSTSMVILDFVCKNKGITL